MTARTEWSPDAPTVVRRIGSYYYVRHRGLEYACKLRARLSKEKVQVAIGDRVMLDELDETQKTAWIVDVAPRFNLLPRPTLANVDQVVIVMAADAPPFSPLTLDRFLTLAAQSGIAAVVCVNKRDKVSAERLHEMISPYEKAGYPVVTTAAKSQEVAELWHVLENRVSVLAGPSGVGKSSLLNALQPGLELKANEVSEKLGRGRHTTTFASLYALNGPEGEALVGDTPGYSHLDFGTLAPTALGWLFPEMAPHIPHCRFPDCLHREEPDCAVKAHAAMTPERYASYLRFLDELLATEKRLSETSIKVEEAVKFKSAGGGTDKKLVKLGVVARTDSRRVAKQKLAGFDMDDLEAEDADLEGDEDEAELSDR
jgi:ribosome biogenesis GTPase